MTSSTHEHDDLVIHGARENNLKGLSLRLPKRKITVFTGVSGSGKSSLVFDTLAAEAQRQLNENFSTFARRFLPKFPQPRCEAIENLNMAVVIDQKRLGGGFHSTVGTVTDIASVLRLLFARAGQPNLGSEQCFSFHDPQGMCPACSGMGQILGPDLGKMIDPTRSLAEGGITFPEYAPGSWGLNKVSETGMFDMTKKLGDFTSAEMDKLLHTKATKVPILVGGKSMNLTFEGIVESFLTKYVKRDLKSMSEKTQKQVEPFLTMVGCDECRGTRLNQAALGSRVAGLNIAEMTRLDIDELQGILLTLGDPSVAPLTASLTGRLQHLIDIGLGYLSLDRATDSLSGGESVRVKMVKHLTSSLVDVLYIFDEPSVGLHPRDVHRLNELLVKLKDKGNTVLVVEHDPDVVKIADHVVDLGPGAGSAGGHIVFEGSFAQLLKADTLTGRHLKSPAPWRETVRRPTGQLAIRNAVLHNLRDLSLTLPQGVLTVVTGVAGSGKSSLIRGAFLAQHPDTLYIDQSGLAANSRSSPATYTGIMDGIRKAFAGANKVVPALFSFNSKGACDTCQGLGVVYTDLAFLDEVRQVCPVCGGKRFKDEVLVHKLNGKSIAEVLDLTVAEALAFFETDEIRKVLTAMNDVGLEYMSLGQPLSTLSGGECQRIKLASEIHKKSSVYVLDEPTTGLHPSDTAKLLQLFHRMVDAGNTLIVIEHNLDVIRQADWIVDLGPEAGHHGGQLVYEGTPRGLLDCAASLTGRYLKMAEH